MPAPISVPPSWGDWTLTGGQANTTVGFGVAASTPLSSIAFDVDALSLFTVPFDERWQLQHASLLVDVGGYTIQPYNGGQPAYPGSISTPATLEGYLWAGPYFAPRFIIAAFDNTGATQFFNPAQPVMLEPTASIGVHLAGSGGVVGISTPLLQTPIGPNWPAVNGTGINYPIALQLQYTRQKQRA